MNIKMLYMKLVGFVMVVTGFAYSLTSFYNFWSYLFGDIQVANTNVGIMAIGLIVPLYLLPARQLCIMHLLTVNY